VTIKVYQGERELAQYNKALGEFNLEGINPAPRGTPQIEVTLDIDANGILHVSARDKNTGKENKITIKANSGLTDAEIDQMVRDAEANAEADRRQRELIESRNQADSAVHSVRSDLNDIGSKLSEDERTGIEDAIKAVETAAAGDEVEVIQQAIANLQQVSVRLQEVKNQKSTEESDDNVVDAEFKETK
jgi:molecular chaperone DnaK